MENPLKLSICIATYNRGRWIGETLDSIVRQLQPGVELVIVDGASSDNTADVIQSYAVRYPQIGYYRETENGGVDRDYDKAVDHARGEYCWLMTDDDLIKEGGVADILSCLGGSMDLVVVNAEVRNIDLTRVLAARQLNFMEDKQYNVNENEAFFSEVANYLSFIGAVIIRRDVWKRRKRSPYYGTLFIHLGVICQHPPLKRIYVKADPLIIIRYGNALWTPHTFEIWMFKWPQFIWAFSHFSDKAKALACYREPWKRIKVLFLHRGLGRYTLREYRRFIAGPEPKGRQSLLPCLVALFPIKAANFFATLYFVLVKRKWHMDLDSLVRSPHATCASRFLTRFLKVPTV